MSLDLAGVFAAGFLTYLTPCVLPLVPVYLAALAGGDIRHLGAGQRGQLVFRALFFALGFIVVFTAMGMAASSAAGLLAHHKLALQTVAGVLVLLFGLKFLGVIDVPLLDRVARVDEGRFQSRYGWANALLMGVLFAAGWSPCVGPILGSVLSYTASKSSNPVVGATYLGVYGLGFALPLLLTAVFAEAGLRLLRRLRAWLPRIERATGVLLVGLSAILLFDLHWPPAVGAPAAGVGASATAAVPVAGDALAETAQTSVAADPVVGPTMLELYSGNCPICREMMPVVAHVVGECKHDSVHVRQVDINDPHNRAFIEQYRLVGVPTFLFIDASGTEVARLVGRQTPESLRQSLAALRGERCPGVGLIPPPPAPASEPAGESTASGHTACGIGAAAEACNAAH